MFEMPVLCPYCCDLNIEPVPEAKLCAEIFSHRTIALSASVFRCSHWHIFATFPSDCPTTQHSTFAPD